jgi:preprotein translocase subunit SecD
VIYTILSFVFGGIALLCLIGAWLKRSKRLVLVWAALAAGVASVAALTHNFWPIPVFGLMVVWALIGALNTLTLGWRLKAGLTVYALLGSLLALFPTYHDEIMCGDDAAWESLPATCPKIIESLPSDERTQLLADSADGKKSFRRFLLANLTFRMVRGLDLKGGARTVYTVEVDEAIRDMRDRKYDDLRAALAKSYGFVQGDVPTDVEMQKLRDVLTLKKPAGTVNTIVVEFKDPADAKTHVNDKFVAGFLNELEVVRSPDGRTVTFTIRKDVDRYVRERAVSQAKETVLRRVDGLGVKEASISVRDEDIIIEIPGERDADFEAIRDIISQTARLEFKLLDDEANFLEPHTRGENTPQGIEFDIENAPIGPGKTQPNFYARVAKKPGETMEEALERLKKWTSELPLDEDHEIGFGKYYQVNEETEDYEPAGWRTYYLKSKAELTGDLVRDAMALSDQSDTGFGAWYVNMTLDAKGAELFAKITEANVKKRFAIILDGHVESAPEIREKIGGGQARITMGSGSVQQQLQDARKLELVLRSGALPAPISHSATQRIGPTLGRDSIEQGLTAAGIGGVAVLIIMLLWYRRAGFIANIAVLFNGVLQMALLAMFSASMSLPGIAGLALTVGMSVDANVLINERIREELAGGKSARAAVAAGYDRAFTAIFDGHVTTLLTALILFQYGTGPIKGFAVTLFIGMFCNLFTGVLVTRLFFEVWAKLRRDTRFDMTIPEART